MATNKPDKIDLTTVNEINDTLNSIYGQLDWWRQYLGFTGNIPRIYYHGGDRIEELIARLRGEIAYLAKNVSELASEFTKIENKLNDLIDYIDDHIQEVVSDEVDKIAADLLAQLKEDLLVLVTDNFSAPLHGIPMLNHLISDNALADNELLDVPFITNFQGINSNGLQAIELDGSKMEWYGTMSDGVAAPDEGFIVIRTNSSGQMIDQMYVPKGGHGQNTFLRVDGDVVWFYFNVDNKVYRVDYKPFTTASKDTDWEAMLIDLPLPTKGVQGFDYTASRENNNAFVWRFVNTVNERDANNVAYSESHYFIYGTNASFKADGTWDFTGEVASIDIQPYVEYTHDNSIQGTAVLNKRDVTGADDGTNQYYIFVSYGWNAVKSEILVLLYDQDKNTITYQTIIRGLDRLIRDRNDRQKFELEGLTHIRYNLGTRTAAGLIFSNVGGRSGSTTNRVFGFINNDLLTLMASFNRENSSEVIRRWSDTDTIDYLWKYGQGSFVIRETEWKLMKDAPVRWRGLRGPTAYVFLDTQGKADAFGRILQELTILSYVGPVERYFRYVSFSFNGKYGAEWSPDLTPWQLADEGYGRGKTPTANQTAMYQLTERCTQYITANTANFDYEGLDKTFSYAVTAEPIGALNNPDGTTYLQTAVIHNVSDNAIVTYQRYVRGVVDSYGSSLTTNDYHSTWRKFRSEPTFDTLNGGLSWLGNSVRETNDLVQVVFSGITPSDVDFTDEVAGGKIPAGITKPTGTIASFGIIHNITSTGSSESTNVVVSIKIDPDGTVTFNGNGVIPGDMILYGSVIYVKDI